MTQAICTKVNRNSIRELLEWLERETGVRWICGGEKPTEFDPFGEDMRTVAIAYDESCDSEDNDNLSRCWPSDSNNKLVTPSTFKAAVKLACPREAE